jgi:phosphodiesterase/alkaline phosphatase D-like protein
MSRPARLALPLAAAVLALLVFSPSALAARGFSLGVAAGEVTSSSVKLWAKARESGRYTVHLAARLGPNRTQFITVQPLRALARNDNTIQVEVNDLRPGTRYRYHFTGRRGRRSDVGVFRTAPRPGQNRVIEFAWTGDTDFSPQRGESRPHWNGGGIFRRIRSERNDFNIHLGDTIYSDSEVPGRLRPIALTVPQKWAKYKVNLGNRHLRAVRGSAGFYSHWDDHEFVNDFSPAESTFSNDVNINGRRLFRRGVRAFEDYAPVDYSRRRGLYRSVRWGSNLEVFFLDQRSFRDAKADDTGVCDNPDSGGPDFAPTAPQRVRNVFGAVEPSLLRPVPQACLDAIRDPNRDFLGAAQFRTFRRAIRRSTARFKVVMSEMPIQQHYVLPYDRWEGYEAERQRMLRFLSNQQNVVVLTTEEHATLVNDARFQTLEDGGPRDSGVLEVIVGPAATANFALEIDDTVDRPGTGELIDSAFFEPPPPNGIGMRCSILDQFSYGQVRVTRNRLTITPKGIDGRRQTDDGQRCGPFVLNFER